MCETHVKRKQWIEEKIEDTEYWFLQKDDGLNRKKI